MNVNKIAWYQMESDCLTRELRLFTRSNLPQNPSTHACCTHKVSLNTTFCWLSLACLLMLDDDLIEKKNRTATTSANPNKTTDFTVVFDTFVNPKRESTNVSLLLQHKTVWIYGFCSCFFSDSHYPHLTLTMVQSPLRVFAVVVSSTPCPNRI